MLYYITIGTVSLLIHIETFLACSALSFTDTFLTFVYEIVAKQTFSFIGKIVCYALSAIVFGFAFLAVCQGVTFYAVVLLKVVLLIDTF